jgi:HSP20 family molecular chaperone IbpA
MKPSVYKPLLSDSLLSIFDSPLTELAPLFARNNLITGDTVRFSSTSDRFTIEVDLPGAKREDTNVEITGDHVYIAAKRTVTTQGGVREETLTRSFSLAKDADLDTVQATQENGILKVTVMRKNADKHLTRTVAIN